jgi:hypothetical protein
MPNNPEGIDMAKTAGEWSFLDTTAPPPANGQIRLSQTVQSEASLMWISRNTATGVDATAALTGILPGERIRLENKNDPSKWQVYAVTGMPVVSASHVEYPVIWVEGGVAIPQQRTFVSTEPAGNASIPVDITPLMKANVGSVEVIGHILREDLVFPSDGPHGFAPGLTKRQWYAGQAMVGFISAAPANAPLMGGRLAEYCFKAADSMLALEAAEEAGKTPPLVGSRRG